MTPKQLDARARVLRDVHAFFESRGFMHVDTPSIVPSPGMDTHLATFAVDIPKRGRHWLATSPEYQMKRVLADHARIYQVCRAYRRDEEGHLHNPEFSILEWYRADASVSDVMQDTEQLVARVTGGSIRVHDARITTTPPFLRLSVRDAFERFADVQGPDMLTMASMDEERFFRLLIDRVEPGIASLQRPVFLVDYPACMASLARKKLGDEAVAERFELYLAGVELCNGFGELVDAAEQRARFEADQRLRGERGQDVYPIDDKLLDALARLPPSAGNALGIDRLAMLACGAASIGEVMSFTLGEL